MAKGSISLRSLNETLNRVESRLLSLEARFTQLDSSLQSLAHEFDLQEEMLEEDLRQDVPWAPAARDQSHGAKPGSKPARPALGTAGPGPATAPGGRMCQALSTVTGKDLSPPSQLTLLSGSEKPFPPGPSRQPSPPSL